MWLHFDTYAGERCVEKQYDLKKQPMDILLANQMQKGYRSANVMTRKKSQESKERKKKKTFTHITQHQYFDLTYKARLGSRFRGKFLQNLVKLSAGTLSVYTNTHRHTH